MNPPLGFSSLGILLLSKHTRSVEKLVDRGGIAKKDFVGKPESHLAESLSGRCLSQCKQGSL